MKSLLSKFTLTLAITLFVSNATYAEKIKASMVTGPATGTYIRVGQDISNLMKKSDFTIDVKESKGSLDNIKLMGSADSTSLGIVQADVLNYLSHLQDDDSKKIAGHLRLVMPLYNEEIHVLARKDISTFIDLDGKKIITGEEGSGSWLTAMNLFAMTGIKPGEIMRVSPAQGALDILKGRADAMIFVGGKPVRLFQNLEELAKSSDQAKTDLMRKVHFLPLNVNRFTEEYSESSISYQDYSFVEGIVPTISVYSALISFDTGASPEETVNRCKTVGAIVQSVLDNISFLRLNGHSKWSEIEPDADLSIWQKDKCAEATQTSANDKPMNPMEEKLLNTIKQRW